MTERLKKLCDEATLAHEKVQANHVDLNPIVGVHHKMRDAGFPADIMTIDCLKSGKRIVIILNDDEPEKLVYQFSFKAQDPTEAFESIAFDEVDADKLYQWMTNYFKT